MIAHCTRHKLSGPTCRAPNTQVPCWHQVQEIRSSLLPMVMAAVVLHHTDHRALPENQFQKGFYQQPPTSVYCPSFMQEKCIPIVSHIELIDPRSSCGHAAAHASKDPRERISSERHGSQHVLALEASALLAKSPSRALHSSGPFHSLGIITLALPQLHLVP